MKKFLRKIFLYAILFSSSFGLLNLFFANYNNEPKHYELHYQELINQDTQANGIILGSSFGTHGIQPSLLDTTGISFFNFALNGAGPSFYLNWYQKLFSPNYPKPIYCVYVVNWFMFDRRSLERQFEHDAEYFPYHIFMDFLTKHDDLDANMLIRNKLPAIKYRSRVWHSLMLEQGDKRFVLEEYDRGFIPYEIPFLAENFPEKLETPEILDSEVEAFEKLIEELQAENIKIIILMTPEYQVEASEFQKQYSLELIKNIAQKRKIPFLNFNIELRSDFNQNLDYYSDGGHLNKKGSAVFSKILANELLKIYQKME